MPIYEFHCPSCGHEEERITKYADRNDQLCGKCELETNFKPTYRFNSTGLPNGFASTRSKSRREE